MAMPAADVSPNVTYFWGEMDAMHQFCEAKYVVSPFVAEFWNATSNIPFFILPALYCLYWSVGVYDFRVVMMWLNMLLVGIGSLMFHGTMRFKWEMLDELPMFLLVLSGVFAKDDTHWLTSGRWKRLVHAVCLGISALGMSLYILRNDYEIFVHSFTIMLVLDFSLGIVCSSGDGLRATGRELFLGFAAFISAGRFFWEVETRSCTPGQGGHLAALHVLWHALAGVACYVAGLANAQVRCAALGVGSRVDAPGSCWPLVPAVAACLRRGGGAPAARAKADLLRGSGGSGGGKVD